MPRTREMNGYLFHHYYSPGKSFDYLRAWHDLAYPAYEALDDEVRKLAEATCIFAADLSQTSDLTMPWPDAETKLTFTVMADEQPTALAKAARVVYFTGHWFSRPILKSHFEPCGPGQWELIVPKKPMFAMVGELLSGGGSWKFSHYADQALRERLGIKKHSKFAPNNQAHFEVIEGMLRLCLSYKGRVCGEGWTWNEVGLATPARLAHVRKIIADEVDALSPNPEADISNPDTLDRVAKRLKDSRNSFEQAWLTRDKFTVIDL